MKKILALSLITLTHYVSAYIDEYYSINMHVTHDEYDYAKSKWDQCAELTSNLAATCQATADDNSAEAFRANQKEAIKIIKDIFSLCKEENSLHFAITLENYQPASPSTGLVISLSFAIENNIHSENKRHIQSLFSSLQERHNPNNLAIFVHNLDIIESVIDVLAGQANLNVTRFDDIIIPG